MKSRKSIFSWLSKELENPEAVFSFLDEQGIAAIYQHVTATDSKETVALFIEIGRKYNKKIYLLTGEPNWALEPENLLCQIEQASDFDGIVVDVEPYLLKGFNEKIMTTYVSTMRIAYQKSQSLGISFILCIPYFYDSLGFAKKLEELVRDCCDGITVMNYYRGKEREHLENEAKLCLAYGKTLETIYELQPPGKHGLKDINTYFNLGLKKVAENFNELAEHYSDQTVQISYHAFINYQALAK